MTAAGSALALVGALCLAAAAPSPADPGDQAHGASAAGAPRAEGCHLNRILRPTCGVLFGAFAQPRGSESSEQAFKRLERTTGGKLRIMHFYHQGTELFPTPWEIKLSNHGRRLLLNWKPEAGHSWAEVARGAADGYIDSEARYLRQHYHKKFFLVIHHEPENEIGGPGSGYTAADFASMFRHVENRLKGDGVRNAVYVMNYMGVQSYAEQPWYKDLWPGNKYVDWIGFDAYTTPSMNGQDGGFKYIVNRHWGHGAWRGAYNWAHRRHPHKPVMLPEWGVAEKPGAPGWKSWYFGTVPAALRKMPNLELITYFDNPNGNSAGDVRPDTSEASRAGWRSLAAKAIFHR